MKYTLRDWKNNDVADALLEIRAGQVPGAKIVDVLGYNPAVDATLETLWANGGFYEYLSVAEPLRLVSSSTSDTAVVVKVKGLDSNGLEIEEDVTLTGTTPVITTNSYLRLLKAYNTGSINLVGNVTITSNVTSKTQGYFSNIEQTTMLGMYTVPANCVGFALYMSISVDSGKDIELWNFMRQHGKVFTAANKWAIYQTALEHDFKYARIEPMTDLQWRAKGTSGSVSVSANASLLLIDTTEQKVQWQ